MVSQRWVTGDMRVLIEQIARALVDDPAQVSVNQVEEGAESVLEPLVRTIWAG